jgi:hypothetical protein
MSKGMDQKQNSKMKALKTFEANQRAASAFAS